MTETQLAQALLDTPDAFEIWLKAFEGEYVGWTCRSGTCPIAMFLLESGIERPIEATGLTIRVKADAFASPRWVAEFILSIDTMHQADRQIDAGEALFHLRCAMAAARRAAE